MIASDECYHSLTHQPCYEVTLRLVRRESLLLAQIHAYINRAICTVRTSDDVDRGVSCSTARCTVVATVISVAGVGACASASAVTVAVDTASLHRALESLRRAKSIALGFRRSAGTYRESGTLASHHA